MSLLTVGYKGRMIRGIKFKKIADDSDVKKETIVPYIKIGVKY